MMARRALVAGAAALAVVLAFGVAAQSMAPDQRAALDTALRWLVPIDAGRYADAWAMAAAPLKATVGRQEWQDGMRKIRKDYGRVVNRKAGKIAYVGEAPGPDYPSTGPKEGVKIGILFDTTFAGNKAATEEVTMVYEKDGLWRVAGYYIR
jgi:hypothetical protein